jgi:hypothetical protein
VTSFIVWQLLSFYELKNFTTEKFWWGGGTQGWVKRKCNRTALPSEVLPISL